MSVIWLKESTCMMCGYHEVVECTDCNWSWCDYCGAGNTCDCAPEKESK